MDMWLERLGEALADVEPVSPRRQEALEGMARELHVLDTYRLQPVLWEGEDALPGTRRAMCLHDDDGQFVMWVHTEDDQMGLVMVGSDAPALSEPTLDRGVWRDRALAVWEVVQNGHPPAGTPDPYGLDGARWYLSDVSMQTDFPMMWKRGADVNVWHTYNAVVAREEEAIGGLLAEDMLSDVELQTAIARVAPVLEERVKERRQRWDEVVAQALPERLRAIVDDIGAHDSSEVVAHLRGVVGTSMFDTWGRVSRRDEGGHHVLLPPQGEQVFDAVLAERRLQAFEAYPFAAPLLMGPDLAPVVDAAVPLFGHLARQADLAPAVVRRLTGVPAASCGLRYTSSHEDTVADDRRLILDAVRAVDPNHLPTDDEGWKAFVHAVDVCASITLSFGGEDTEGVSTLHPMAALRGRYDIAARLDKHGASNDFWDYGDGLRSKVYVPAVAYVYAQQGLVLEDEERDSAFKRRPIEPGWPRVPEAFAMSARYHNNLPALDEALPPLPEHMARAWQPLLGEWDAGNGVVLRERTSTRVLRADGAALSECAGGFTKHVVAGKSLVFGAYVDGRLVGNLECVGPDGPRFGTTKEPFAVFQNQGWKNNAPHPRVKAVEGALVHALQRIPPTKVALYSKGLDEARKGWRHPDGVSEDAGYDASDKANIRRAFEAFAAHKVLPPRHAQMGFDRWMAEVITPEVQALRLGDLDKERIVAPVGQAGRASNKGLERDL